jgi:ATP adenylyltransferase
MERLWAPWRAGYILGQGGEGKGAGTGEVGRGCIFCDALARGEAHHAEDLVLCVTAAAFVIMNRYPYNSGHLMVVPRDHVRSPTDLPAAAHDALFRLVTASTAAVQAALAPDGMNLGLNLGRVAGAGIPDHFHVHLVPRWSGDNSFMPVVADTRVISQELRATYEALRPHFEPLAGTP